MKINELVFDSQTKEYVIISNGVPVIEGKPEIKPTEAMALRVIGLTDDGKPKIAFTYRKVEASKLSTCESSPLWIAAILGCNPHKQEKHFHFIGRV